MQSLVQERLVYGRPAPTLCSPQVGAEPSPSPYSSFYAIYVYGTYGLFARGRRESVRLRFISLELRTNVALDELLTTCYP